MLFLAVLACLLSLGLGSAIGAAVYKKISTRAIEGKVSTGNISKNPQMTSLLMFMILADVAVSASNVAEAKKNVENNDESQTNVPGKLCLTPGCVQSGKILFIFTGSKY